MTSPAFAWFVVRALAELIKFDVQRTPWQSLAALRVTAPAATDGERARRLEVDICRAVLLAAALYWKPVLCLQRSHCVARLLRAHGVPARLVIGYRPVPFFSHAWVEVAGRVVNDSPVYRQRLRILHTA